MDAGKLVKWVVILALLAAAYKVGLPWLKQQKSGGGAKIEAADSSCPAAAERASAAWGAGLGRFVNPPYDLEAWNVFREGVDSRIKSAADECGCPGESCKKAADAMGELRSLVTDLDQAIRSGSPPSSDVVQRQASIDNAIDRARELAREGK